MRWIVALVWLTGCDLVFELQDPTESPDPVVSCKTRATAITDAFNDQQTLPLWREEVIGPDNSIDEMSNGVFLNMGSAGSAELRMATYVDLRDSAIYVLAQGGGQLVAGSKMALELETLDYQRLPEMGHTIRIGVDEDTLVAEYSENGAFSPVHSATYERPEHHYWKVEQRGPTTTFSTAADGVNFTPLMAIEFPFEIGFVRPVLSASRVTQDFAALFSELNGGGVPVDPVCAAGELRDNFTVLDRDLWGRLGVLNATAESVDGKLVLAGEGVFGAELGTSTIYNLVGQSFSVDVEPMIAGACTARLEVLALDGGIGRFEVNATDLSAKTILGGQEELRRQVPYDPTAHRFWRFVGALGVTGEQELRWETSADGLVYEPFIAAGNFVELDRAQLAFNLNGIANAGECLVRFDNVNL